MYRILENQKLKTRRTARHVSRPSADVASGLAERLALYVFGVLCLIAWLLESPVPMAIAP